MYFFKWKQVENWVFEVKNLDTNFLIIISGLESWLGDDTSSTILKNLERTSCGWLVGLFLDVHYFIFKFLTKKSLKWFLKIIL
jgi:hypothetical protein